MPDTWIPGLAAVVLIVVTGLRLTWTGRPFGTVPLALHKLITLGIFVSLGAILFRGGRAALYTPSDWAAIGLAGGLFLGAFVTGGIVIVADSPSSRIVWTHRIGSWMALAASAWCAFLG